ncbi:GSCFA domain-containing protein [Hymenobacter convexus]|uniref:GSCFA domain-containing protein n=1 Tax=Hymenobacter sp. CA1UV-4 TaxID=3063782 RepID=UPI00271422D7|nr:GSCFA domain-containing protein [Hymenobacter sp. CA1UV-4]MDO7852742.1 GSCFA domain-containing protein [Hymenobacter sp. CA1UV-4]
MGSCFADSIGSRLLANKVDALVNPFGTVFQPLALAQLLRAAAGEDVDWQRHLVEARGRWQSYDLHGSIGADSPVELLQHIQELVRRTGEFVRQADVVLLTLGTAWAYRLRETGQLVNNCHKQSADLFVRELLTPDEIINALAETHAYLRRINPKLRFVLTVSPVRHLKETLQLNTVSKSVLRVATHIVSDLLPGVAYFPAYELLVDDLRDYRFYAADMLHPSEVAEDYIWEKFARAYFDADFGRFRKEWASVRQSLGHRPLHAGAPEHRQFLESTLQKLEQMSLRRVEVSDELRTVRTQLAALPAPRQPEPVAEIEDGEERIDIGEGSVVSTVDRSDATTAEVAQAAEAALAAATAKPAEAESRPPRLSPEEFRAQRAERGGRPERGRRDGRGKNRQAQPSENEQFQLSAAADEVTEVLPIMPDARAESVASLEAELTELSAGATDAAAGMDATAGSEQAKKKKRRSRGGAKRTARKHALRLAAEQGLMPEGSEATDDSTEPNSPAEAAAIQSTQPPERQKSSVIVKSVPVKRGGRRDAPGRVPRVPLFAAAAEPDAVTPVTGDAELAPPALSVAPVELPEVLNSDVTSESVPGGSKSRNSRNRKKKSAARANAVSSEPVEANATADAGAEAVPQISPVIGTAEQLSGVSAATTEAETNDRGQEAAATPVSATIEAAAAVTAPVPAAPASRSPRRSKGRAVSGARSEKPEFDTPVVPVQDASQLRTQVAAGRLTGSSASLVEPTAPLKKPAASKKASTAKAAPKVAAAEPEAPKANTPETETPKASVAKKPASSKPKAKSVPAAAPVSEVLAATLEIVPSAPVVPAISPKPKPSAKAKATADKAAPKAASKAAASKVAPKVAAKPKTTTAKAAASTPAAKPKPPKKPAKPA